MTSFRIRVLALLLVALVILAGGGFWIASRNAADVARGGGGPGDSSTSTESADVVQSPGTASAPTNSSSERVDPKVAQDIASDGTTEVLVVFEEQPSGTDDEKRALVQQQIDELTASLPAGSWRVEGETPTVAVANLVIDSDALAALQRRQDVRRVSSARHEFFPAEVSNGEFATDEVGISATTDTMGAPVAWAAGFKGAGTTVAVLDTGVQTDHPFLSRGTVQKTIGEACFASDLGFTSPCPGGVSMGINDPSKVGAGAPCPVDLVTNGQKECDHGTHVAGIAAGGNGTGTSGIAPDATLIAVQIFSYRYSTNKITSDNGNIDNALQWLYNRRADFPGLTVVNLSVGGTDKYTDTTSCDDDYPSTLIKVQQLLDVGIVTVVAAGNEGWSDGVSAPGCLSNVVSVAALGSGATPNQRASYSNFGPQVNLFAPGTLTSSIPCSQYVAMSGTSMATPAVSGSIALLRQSSVGASVSRLESTGLSVIDSVPPFAQLNRRRVSLGDAIAGLPGPTGPVTGVASGSQVAVSWTAASPGSGSISQYRVTAFPGGQTCTTAGLSCAVTGLDQAKSYVFTVVPTGTSGVGPGRASASIPMANVPPVPTDYVPLLPVRLLDTRSVSAGASTIDGNDLGCGAVGQAQTRSLVVEGRGGVPTSGVDAVALNVTVVSPTASNFLRVYPSGSAPPNASNINFLAGQTIPNMVIARVGSDGRIAIYNEQGSSQVVVDVVGWFPDGSDYTGVDPQRLLDTRTSAQGGGGTIDGGSSGGGPIGQGQTLLLPVVGRGTVPATGVGAVALNVTAITPTESNFLKVYPSGVVSPNVSNLNFTAGQTIANMVIAKVGADGRIALFNNAGSTQVVVDIVGWFPSVSEFTGIVPQRFVDTRSCGACTTVDGQYQAIGPIAPGGSLTVQMAGRGPSPSSPEWIPSNAGAVALNVTVVGSTASNFLTVFPAGGARPVVSNLNFVAGQTIPNMVMVKLGVGGADAGKITIYNNAGSTPVLVDVVGWFPSQ